VEASEESWNRVIAVNQTSVFLTCKHALPQMVQQGSGVIINIGSVAALRWIGFPYAAYSASKAAIIALTQNIAAQYARQGIRANCVLPGLMDTPMIREPLAASYGGDVDTMLETRHKQSPTGRMGGGWDTAYAALFLASDEARYITGAQLVVDGGLTLRCV
jgi:NAD(P)-dependent dehydrogenase (short-subunit alcohol dehydrogenase family)